MLQCCFDPEQCCLTASTESREGLGAREPPGKGLPSTPRGSSGIPTTGPYTDLTDSNGRSTTSKRLYCRYQFCIIFLLFNETAFVIKIHIRKFILRVYNILLRLMGLRNKKSDEMLNWDKNGICTKLLNELTNTAQTLKPGILFKTRVFVIL